MRCLTVPDDRLEQVYQLLQLGGQVVQPRVQDVPSTDELEPLTRAVYVDPAEAPGGNGSIARPFRTIQEAADWLFGVGGVVLLTPGVHLSGAPIFIDVDTPLTLVSLGTRASGATAEIQDEIVSSSALALVGCQCTTEPVSCRAFTANDSVCFDLICQTLRAYDSTLANIVSTSTTEFHDCLVNGTVTVGTCEAWNTNFATVACNGNLTLRGCTVTAACSATGSANVLNSRFGLALTVTGALTSDLASVSTILSTLSFGSFTAAERANKITLSVLVPAVAAGQVGYVNISLVGTDLEGMVPVGSLLHANPTADLVAAGAGGGFINVRCSAVNQARFAFLGPLAGGASNFLLAVL